MKEIVVCIHRLYIQGKIIFNHLSEFYPMFPCNHAVLQFQKGRQVMYSQWVEEEINAETFCSHTESSPSDIPRGQ